MKDLRKFILIILSVVVLILAFFGIRMYFITQTNYEAANICQNDDLIARLIVNNINPFTKFKFIKKRNVDCKVLLITNKEDAEVHKTKDFCPLLDASTNSVTMLIYTYVNDMYDRDTASKELKQMVPLMIPYSYCPKYYDNLLDLVTIKKRLGL